MAKAIRILGRHTSYNVQKVLWLADELSLQYEHIQKGGRFGGTDSEEFLAMNPLGKVPVLQDGQNVVFESNTILRYLADVYGGDNWIAENPFQRTLTDRWLDWSIDRLEPAFVAVFWGFYRTPKPLHDPVAIKRGVADCEACLEVLGRQLGIKSFLVSDQLTLADVATAVFLHRLYSIDLQISIPENILQWYKRLAVRPAFARWVMSDYSELQGRAGY